MEPFDKLAAQLSKLFELEKADLDFGIHRIIKARQKHIRVFLGLDDPPAEDPGAPTLKKIVQREMGELNTVELGRQLKGLRSEIESFFTAAAFDENGALTDENALALPKGKEYQELHTSHFSLLTSHFSLQTSGGANAQLEAEIYSHLTEFFSRYYDEADFLSKRRIKAGDAPYAVPYSGEEVMLHWANKDQYYIKSSKDLKDYTFTLPDQFGGKRVQFKCQRQDPVLNNNNAKREFHLDLDEDGNPQIATSTDADGKEALVIGFHFKIVDKTRTQPETKAWIEHLLELLPSADWKAALSHTPEGAKNNLLTRHLHNYTRKNEADFFIHKHLGKFLRGELDFYIKNEVMHLDDIDEKSTDYLTTRVRLIKALRTIARHIIRFLAQLENFQKKLWLKKKYVTETQYCFTLDRVMALGKPGQVLLDTLLRHVDDKIRRYDGEMRSQHDEWIKLYAIDELEDYPKNGKLTVGFLKAHDKLMLDTVFYPPGFKWQLLGAMEDLEEQLDGLLIHSENFQALNLLQDRYREKVKCVYIDPPYNTGGDGFLYKDRYQHSSWACFVAGQYPLARTLLDSADGVLFSSIDDGEQDILRKTIGESFGQSNFVANIIWQKKYAPANDATWLSDDHDFLICFARDKPSWAPGKLPRNEKQNSAYSNPDGDERGEWRADNYKCNKTADERPNLFYAITNPNTNEGIWPNRNAVWRYTKERHKENEENNRVWWGLDRSNSTPAYKRFLSEVGGMVPRTIWKYDEVGHTQDGIRDLRTLLPDTTFTSPKPTGLIQRAIQVGKGDLTLDYFAGSGTTAHAVINLNREDSGSRNYILVEMGDHFDTVLKPRIQKVVYSAGWKEGKPTAPDTGISHGFKYLRLESYEDALNNLDLGKDRAPDLLGLGDQVREDFLFSYLLDVETRGHLLNLDRFRDPWGCQLKIHDPHTGKSEARVIDLVETFHYLLGVTVREIRVQGPRDKPDAFLTIEGESPDGEAILIIWRRLEANPDVDAAHKIDWPVTDNEDLKAFAAAGRGTARGLNPADTEFHAIYLNGDHTLADPNSKIHCIEEVFYERMFANTGNPED